MSPKGTRPSFTSAWKPLQMPSMRPSRACSRSRTASVTSGARKNAVMNFAEPSGSSPPEKPPGIMTIWDARMSRASSAVDLGHRLGRQVVHHVHGGHGAGPLEGGGGVVLAVVAGEHRDDHARSAGGVAQQRRAVVGRGRLPFEADGGHRLGRCALFRRGAVREHAFKPASALPGLLHHGEIGHLAVARQLVSAGHLTELPPHPRWRRVRHLPSA